MAIVVLLPVPIQPEAMGEKEWQILGLEATIRSCQGIAAENLKTARRFVKAVSPEVVIDSFEWFEFDKHTASFDNNALKAFLKGENRLLVVSEAGCPGVGDPGAEVVKLAHSLGADVLPLPGQCSFLLALMGSGLNGQAFSFNGYLPIDSADFRKKITKLEQQSAASGATQIVMDTPFRTNRAFASLVNALSPQTRVCLAYNLYGEGQILRTKTAAQWRKALPELGKQPAVFLFQA